MAFRAGDRSPARLKIALGVVQSLILAIRLRPQVLFLTGGWVGFPMAAACWLLRRPIVIYVLDIEPGPDAWLSWGAITFSPTPSAQQGPCWTAAFFPGKRRVTTGYPLRPEILSASREAGLRALDSTRRKTLLVSGGSRGSRSINTAMKSVAPALLADGAQIVHISGQLDWETVQAQHAALSEAQRAFGRFMCFLPDIEYSPPIWWPGRAGRLRRAEYLKLALPAIPCRTLGLALPEGQRRPAAGAGRAAAGRRAAGR